MQWHRIEQSHAFTATLDVFNSVDGSARRGDVGEDGPLGPRTPWVRHSHTGGGRWRLHEP